jgi:diguanylate cyclase (GGDEF)-like protein
MSDLSQAIEIAPRIWWVGSHLPDDSFQCHVYLIEQGDQSVLVDPGSRITFAQTLEKIEQVIPFSSLRYFICHHQDPDITACLPQIDALIQRPDALYVTHQRAHALLKHYDLRHPFWCVDQHAWELRLPERTLKFVFTPYAHFPGAFCTFDTQSRILFSSDLFGGFTKEFSLYAQDESYFEHMRPFHEHYMPSRDILGFALTQVSKHAVRMIAPQHGSIIPEPLVPIMIERLRELECGLYLMAHGNSDIHQLSKLNRTLVEISETMMLHRDFRDIAGHLQRLVQNNLPVRDIHYFSQIGNGTVLEFSAKNRYAGVEMKEQTEISRLLGMDKHQWREHAAKCGYHSNAAGSFALCRSANDGVAYILIPLFSPDSGAAEALAVLRLRDDFEVTPEVTQILHQISVPLQVALERESIHQRIDKERQQSFERSIRDPLTGLYNRFYMQNAVKRLCDLQDRESSSEVVAVMLDLDHFKHINDTFGHCQGDEVLIQVTEIICRHSRETDIPVRYGGEEFVIFLVNRSPAQVDQFAQRLRRAIKQQPWMPPSGEPQYVTVSVGTAVRRAGEPLPEFMRRADEALYQAKHAGRDCVRSA